MFVCMRGFWRAENLKIKLTHRYQCGNQRWKYSKYAINGMLVDQLNNFMGGVTQGRDRIFLGRLKVN